MDLLIVNALIQCSRALFATQRITLDLGSHLIQCACNWLHMNVAPNLNFNEIHGSL